MRPFSSLTVLHYICLSVIGRDRLARIPVVSHFSKGHLMNSLLRMADSSVPQNGFSHACMHTNIRHLVPLLVFRKPPATRLHVMGEVKKILTPFTACPIKGLYSSVADLTELVSACGTTENKKVNFTAFPL